MHSAKNLMVENEIIIAEALRAQINSFGYVQESIRAYCGALFSGFSIAFWHYTSQGRSLDID